MTIPDDETLKLELVIFLANEPNSRASVHRVYDQLAKKHPELTTTERTEPYRNSASKWANRVQFARLHLVNEGRIYRANMLPNLPRGYWALTPNGLEYAQSLKSDISMDLVEANLEKAKEDIAAILFEESYSGPQF